MSESDSDVRATIPEQEEKKEPIKRQRGRPRKAEQQPLWAEVLEKMYEKPQFNLFVGKSHSGKSYLMRYLLHYGLSNEYFKFGVCFQGSKDMNNDFTSFLPKKSVVEYSDRALEAYINQLKAHKLSLKNEGKEAEMPRSFIVFDDIIGQLTKSRYSSHFFSLYRHLNITVFMATQYLASDASSTLVRQQTSYGFFFKSSNINSTDMIHSWFGGCSKMNLKDFTAMFDRITKEKHACMLYIDGENDENNNYLRFIAPENFKPAKFSW